MLDLAESVKRLRNREHIPPLPEDSAVVLDRLERVERDRAALLAACKHTVSWISDAYVSTRKILSDAIEQVEKEQPCQKA